MRANGGLKRGSGRMRFSAFNADGRRMTETVPMNKRTLAAAAFTALIASSGAALADPGLRGDREWRGERVTEQRFENDRFANDRFANDRFDRRWDFTRRLDWIDARINRGFDRGDLTRREARFLRRELFQVARLREAYLRDGLSGFEARDLDDRLDRLSERVRFERRDRDFRDERRWRDDRSWRDERDWRGNH